MRAFTVVPEPPRTVVQNPPNYSPVRFGRSGVQQHAADIRQLASKHVCTVCTDRLCHALEHRDLNATVVEGWGGKSDIFHLFS